ncbi:MAG: glycosyltransferase [Clostridia bacterium]|nr:glycosyltransferase [Clostridia bacterium]
MEKVSIIIPAYNAEKYIERCLKSVLAQKYENKEVIVINDGSTDKTEEKISKYINKIKYIKKKNGGLSEARNVGIEKATGKYIMFIDADDYIEKDLLKNLKPYIDEDIDMIKYKAKKVTEKGEEIQLMDGPIFETIKGEEAFSKMCFTDQLMETAWIYLYKKELLKKNKFQFSKGLYHEDFGLIPLVILKAQTFVSTDICGYNYVQSENSITRNEDYQKTKRKAYDLLIHYDKIVKEIEKYKIQEKTKQDVRTFCTNSILLRTNELDKEDKKQYIKEIRKRKMQKNITAKNPKQLLKRIILEISIPAYLKLR